MGTCRTGDGEVEGVIGKYGVPGENERGERVVDMCVEQELVIVFFKKKGINKYTWIRVANGRVIERALMDYVLITKRMVGRLKDVHVLGVWLMVCQIILWFKQEW